MFSAESEEVCFRGELYPIGNAEDWLFEIERMMRETLRLIIKDALDAYKTVLYCRIIYNIKYSNI